MRKYDFDKMELNGYRWYYGSTRTIQTAANAYAKGTNKVFTTEKRKDKVWVKRVR